MKITITPQLIKTLGAEFNDHFKGGLNIAPTDHKMIAMEVRSNTKKNEYAWLGKMPSVREWLGDRVVQNMAGSSYAIENKDFELTIGVDRNDIEDDNLGVYTPAFEEMGASTGAKACELVYGLLKAGFTTPCYDGQFFFDTDHQVLNENGAPTAVANTDGGAGTPWFLADLSPERRLKPLILQVRKDFEFVARDAGSDTNVFMRKEFQYGADARMNVGYGFWQMIWGSRQTLNAANLATAFAAIEGMKGDYGRPLGLKPTHLIVPPSLRSAANKLANNELGANGESNEWKGTFTPLITPWLA